ncbi:MAG: MMPL family transporter, partial [Glycomyces artemisiae]|nr:MMPL family transporter [Glycomyces artemisiae]
IMIAVFGAFVFSESRMLQQFGVGMAAAIFLDAFVIRVLLVPAIMKVLGRSAWWMPKWLDRALPHVTVEPEREPAKEPARV